MGATYENKFVVWANEINLIAAFGKLLPAIDI